MGLGLRPASGFPAIQLDASPLRNGKQSTGIHQRSPSEMAIPRRLFRLPAVATLAVGLAGTGARPSTAALAAAGRGSECQCLFLRMSRRRGASRSDIVSSLPPRLHLHSVAAGVRPSHPHLHPVPQTPGGIRGLPPPARPPSSHPRLRLRLQCPPRRPLPRWVASPLRGSLPSPPLLQFRGKTLEFEKVALLYPRWRKDACFRMWSHTM
jgi:hypothetical protein